MGRLTEANYRSRRLKLQQHIEAARAAWHDAAFRVEVGEGEPTATADAKSKLDDFEARLSGLDGAWQRELALRQSDRADEITGRRNSIAQSIATALSDRTAAAANVEKHLDGLIAAMTSLEAAERACGVSLSGVLTLLTQEERGTAAGLMAGASFNLSHAWCDAQIAGRLMRAGFDLSGLNWATAGWGTQGDVRSIADHCESANAGAVSMASRILPELWTLIHGATSDGED